MKRLIYISIAVAALAGCTGRQEAAKPVPAVSTETKALAMPDIPATLTDPQSRAAYLAVHFWDNMDFTDRTASLDTAMMEQEFSNFSSILPLVLPDSRQEAADSLLGRALRAGEDVYLFVAGIAEKYLFEPASPMYSEELYEPFAAFAANGAPDAFSADEKLRIIDTNRPGRLLPHFSVTTADGRRVSPDDYAGESFILFFYEPGCETCIDTAGRLQANSAIGNLPVLAIYPGKDTAAWRGHLGELPQHWSIAHDADGRIDGEKILYIRATPTVFVIGPDGTILGQPTL